MSVSQPSPDALPLCVDLDGSLVATDTLQESLIGALRASPWTAFKLPLWLLGGRPNVKAQLAEAGAPDPASLPYRSEVLAYCEEARGAGRPVVLATAADRASGRCR